MNARRVFLARAAIFRERALLLPLADPLRTLLEREASDLEARARTMGRWSALRRREHRRGVSIALASCERACAQHCAAGVCTDAHS